LPSPFSHASLAISFSPSTVSARRRSREARRKLLFFKGRRGRKRERKGKEGSEEKKDGETKVKERERERNTSGHEGERQIKFDHKLHEIVGEPRWSASVL